MIAGVGAGCCKTYIRNCPPGFPVSPGREDGKEEEGRISEEGPAQNLSLQSAGWEPGSSMLFWKVVSPIMEVKTRSSVFCSWWWRRPERSWKCRITTCLVSCLFFPGAPEKVGLGVCKAESLLAMKPIGLKDLTVERLTSQEDLWRASSTRFTWRRIHPGGGPRQVITAIGGQPVSCGGADIFSGSSIRISRVYSSVQSLSRVRLFATPWIAAHQASLSITNSWDLLKPISIESVMPSNHLILCRPLLLSPILSSISYPLLFAPFPLVPFFCRGKAIGESYWCIPITIHPF